MSWSSGDIVLQVQLVDGEDQALTAYAALPLHTWIRLDIFFQVSEVRQLYLYAVMCTFHTRGVTVHKSNKDRSAT